jgi:hypothetical protein
MDEAESNAERDYLWEHFKFNADQRLRAFNFFVVFSVLADGGVFAALEKRAHGSVLIVMGLLVCLLAASFFLIDRRSQDLLRLSVPGLKVYEQKFPRHSRLFALEQSRARKVVRYTVAFGMLFAAEFAFGLGAALYGAKLLWR